MMYKYAGAKADVKESALLMKRGSDGVAGQ